MSKERVPEILSCYGADSPATIANLTRLLNQGRLGGTGRLLILPVDQGVEHGPARSFAANPPAYDPRYHAELAVAAGLSAYAAPLGFIEAVAKDFAGEIPLILKVNGNEILSKSTDPIPAVTASAQDALRLGCAAVGFTIYPGSARSKEMYQEARQAIAEAKALGLAAVLWAYPRGGALSKEGETALDVIAYAAHLACQLGAHIVKVKLPSAFIFQEEAKKIYAQKKIKTQPLAERVRHVVESAFNGRRLVVFSGGPAKSEAEILDEARAIRQGGGTGSIIGRNAFQRPRKQALALLSRVIGIYS
ncbi:MAG: class I fructose-bisphosphate aldolase [Elusimicrobia bacterium]|nr:class I fructose-bisphosphate aldolase [Elusimicrobiota bacterium]